jgi:hypothetical protein
MGRRRFVFLEPSKVGHQHITLIEGYLTALASSEIARTHELHLRADRTTLESLPGALRARMQCQAVPVMDPVKRRLVAKSLLEFLVVAWQRFRLRPGDTLFVSCLLPTSLLLLEIWGRLLPKRGVYVVLHGEIEGLVDPSLRRLRSYGYWVWRWMRARRPGSLLSLVVIDDFIRDRLLVEFPDKLNAGNVFAVHHPIAPLSLEVGDAPDRPSACFIGFRTPAKGFDHFERLAADHPETRFVSIGAGFREVLPAGPKQALRDSDAYRRAIAACDVAAFPYVSGYNVTLSAAALDALSVGVHLAGLDRPFFVSLGACLGPDFVTVCSSPQELGALFDRGRIFPGAKGKENRLERLADSKYGLAAVQRSFEALPIGIP